MAVSFDRQHSKITALCIWGLVLLICAQVIPAHTKRRRHPPVVAFFQGQCAHSFCDQKCRDIDNGGFACECYHGYKLNHDGFTCSSKQAQETLNSAATELQEPDWLKIISLDNDGSSKYDEHSLKTGDENILLDGSVLHETKLTDKSENSLHNTPTTSDTENLNLDASKLTLVSGLSEEILGSRTNKIHFNNSDSLVLSENDKTLAGIQINGGDHRLEIHTLNPNSVEDTNFRSSDIDDTLQPIVHDLVSGVQSLPSDGRSQDSVPSDGQSQAVSSGMDCDGQVCLNGGQCVEDRAVFDRDVRCDCPLGWIGDKCDKAVEVRYPKFYGSSYLALSILKTGYKELDIAIEFRPLTKYGLLVFSAEHENATSDFFSISINDGYIEFRYDCGTGMGVLRSASPVIIGEWNSLKVLRVDNTASLWLNNEGPVKGKSQGSYTRLTLKLNLYIGGYDKMSRIEDRVQMNKGFVGCVEQLVVNGYTYDMRKSDLVGDALFGANVGECSEGVCDNVVCINGGICRVISADRHVCLCPLGTGGENCQHNTQVHIPEFAGYSYLQYKGLKRSALLFMEIELVVKPTKADGVILYNGYMLRGGDFISLSLVAGHLEFRFDLGSGPAILRSPKPIALNQWHWVKISRTGLEGILEIGGHIAAIGQSQGAFTQLTLMEDLFIGGHRNFDETSKLANVSKSFDGCIQKVNINHRPLRLIEDARFGMNIETCEHPCIGGPCLHSGQCVPVRDVYKCHCPLGYAGNNCQLKLDREIDTPKFTGESFTRYNDKKISKRIGGDRIDIRFAIKPTSHNGVLFWSGPDVMLPTSDYIAIGFVKRALQFRYNLGSGEAVISYNNSRLFNGSWHYIHAQRDKQDGFLSVDGREVVEGSSKGSYTMLNTNQILYIGGLSDISQNTARKFASGYVGCLRDLVLAEDYTLQFIKSAQSGRNVVPCL